MRGKILVIRGGAIGDFILTLPAIAALRRRFPGARIELLGYPHIAQLALAAGLVDAVQPIEAPALAGFFAEGGTLAEHLADYFSEFDVILSYLFDPDEVFRGNVARVAPAQFITGPHRPDEAQQRHATEVYLQPLERLAIFEADPVPRLEIAPEPLPDAPLALHPGSGSPRKNWPEAKWRELLPKLADAIPQTLLLVGGEAEGDRLERLAAGLPTHRVAVASNLALSRLAARLRGCCGFVGHDSGITHLAAAVGLPCLVLWPGTPMAVWAPDALASTPAVRRHFAALAARACGRRRR